MKNLNQESMELFHAANQLLQQYPIQIITGDTEIASGFRRLYKACEQYNEIQNTVDTKTLEPIWSSGIIPETPIKKTTAIHDIHFLSDNAEELSRTELIERIHEISRNL